MRRVDEDRDGSLLAAAVRDHATHPRLDEATRNLVFRDDSIPQWEATVGKVDRVAPLEAIGRIVQYVRRIRPQVVFTFPPDGAYGHPDHIAVSQFTAAALVCAADDSYHDSANQVAHRVAKFYYQVDSVDLVELFKELAGGIHMTIDGVEREHVGRHDWAITTRLPAANYWRTAWQAVLRHQSQLPSLGPVVDFADDIQQKIWGVGNFYRVYSLVNGDRSVETDLFQGLR